MKYLLTFLLFVPAIVAAADTHIRAFVEWEEPAEITYGTKLTEKQLNATASVPGSFVYRPALGTILPPGVHDLYVGFVPADKTLKGIARSVQIKVAKAKLWITANNVVRPEGTNNPTLTATVMTNVLGRLPGLPDDIRGKIQLTTNADVFSKPGKYTISVDLRQLETDRYDIVPQLGTLIVQSK